MTIANENMSLANVARADSVSPPNGHKRSGDIQRLVPASESVEAKSLLLNGVEPSQESEKQLDRGFLGADMDTF